MSILLFLFVLISQKVYADNAVLINEFIIDPQPQQVELLNIGPNSANISGWYLDDNGGTTFATIPQNTILYPNSCYVYFGDFNLNKSSADTVRLFNNTAPPTSSSAQLIDFYSYKSSPGTGVGFSRIPDGQNAWTNANSTIGYFNNSGISCIITPTSTPTLTPSPTSTNTPTSIPTLTIEPFNNLTITPTPSPTITPSPIPTNSPSTIDNIFISEVMVHPSTGENEWVELFNNNDFEINLIDWYIDDEENTGSTPKKFSVVILSKSYYIFELSSSVFNNDSDQVRLLDQNKLEKDSFEYNSTQENLTYGRISFDVTDFCLQESSKESVNNSCINPTATPIPTVSSKIITPTPTPTIKFVTTIKIPVQQIYSNNQYPISKQFSNFQKPISNFQYSTNNNNQEVLGVSTINNSFYLNRLIRLFSLLSFIYSILTIVYILIKIKLSYESSFRIHPSSLYPKRRK